MSKLDVKIEKLKTHLKDETAQQDFTSLIRIFKCLNNNNIIWKTK